MSKKQGHTGLYMTSTEWQMGNSGLGSGFKVGRAPRTTFYSAGLVCVET